jgi:hypothetical protein
MIIRRGWRAMVVLLLVAGVAGGQEAAKKKGNRTPIETSGMTTAEFSELARNVRAMDDGKHCGRRELEFGKTISLEELAGGKVKAIRVVRAETYKGAPAVKAEEARAKLEKVWSGRFGFMACQIGWAEPTLWSVEAELEFEDGKKGVLITDGWHVALEDHEGNNWFLR